VGLISDALSIGKVQKLKSGEKQKLSYANVVQLIVNLRDASKNCPNDFKAISKQYNEFRRCNTPLLVDMDGYLEMCSKIIDKFNEIAPYYRYCGDTNFEKNLILEDINSKLKETHKISPNDIEAEEFVDEFNISYKYARTLLQILKVFQNKGTDAGIEALQNHIEYASYKNELLDAKCYLFIFWLAKNNYIDKEECLNLMEFINECSSN